MAVDDLDGARFPLQRVGGFQVSAHSKTCRSSQNTVTTLVGQALSLRGTPTPAWTFPPALPMRS